MTEPVNGVYALPEFPSRPNAKSASGLWLLVVSVRRRARRAEIELARAWLSPALFMRLCFVINPTPERRRALHL